MHQSRNFNKNPPFLFGSTLLAPLVSPASRGPLHYHAAVKLKEGESERWNPCHRKQIRMDGDGDQRGNASNGLEAMKTIQINDIGCFLDFKIFATPIQNLMTCSNWVDY